MTPPIVVASSASSSHAVPSGHSGATELHHKVSNQYQDSATGAWKHKLVHVPKRGIAQLFAGLLTHLQR